MIQCNMTKCEREATVTLHLNIHFDIGVWGDDFDQELNAEFCSNHARERWREYVMKMRDIFDRYPGQ